MGTHGKLAIPNWSELFSPAAPDPHTHPNGLTAQAEAWQGGACAQVDPEPDPDLGSAAEGGSTVGPALLNRFSWLGSGCSRKHRTVFFHGTLCTPIVEHCGCGALGHFPGPPSSHLFTQQHLLGPTAMDAEATEKDKTGGTLAVF